MFRNRQQRRQRDTYGVMLLVFQLLNAGPIPPITLVTILLQVAIYLDFIPFLGPDKTRALCLLPARILRNGEYYRLIAPIFMHADDMHLYYNMVSMLWKGRRLERILGGARFLAILIVFVVSTAATTVALSLGLDRVGPLVMPHSDFEYTFQCGVGFSGVLFALKVLMNHLAPHDNEYLLGWMPIPTRYACWVELLLIQMITPNASFVGHLAGIVCGLAYVWGLLDVFVAPLQAIIETVLGGVLDEGDRPQEYADPRRNNFGWNRAGDAAGAYPGGGATWGDNTTRRERDWGEYTGGLSEEEQLRRAREESMRQRRPYGWANNY